jgi:hypothetical protein
MLVKPATLLSISTVCILCTGFSSNVPEKPFNNQSSEATDWELKKDKNGIKVYTRDYPDSPVKEFKAIASYHCSFKKLVILLNDLPKYPQWLKNCKSVKTVKTVDETTLINYAEIKVPWPFSPRDGVYEYTVVDNRHNLYYAKIQSKPDMYPEKSGIVRMRNANGNWKVEEISDNEVKITHQFFGDPEGNIPGWVVNLFIVDGPYDTLLNLKTLCE